MKCWMSNATAIGVTTLVLAWPMSAQAQTVPADLPSTEQALAAIDQDPTVLQARRAVQVATHSAAMRAAGPYEWTVGATGQRRRIDGSGSTTEWSAQIERPIRIGGKAALDRDIGEAGLRQARAELTVARQSAARLLADQWLDWLAARQSRARLQEQVGFAEASLKAVETRRKAGDASLLEVGVAQGDVAEAKRQASLAAAAEARAQASLRVRYPRLAQVAPTLSEPLALERTEGQWRERILAVSGKVRAAQEALRKAEATGARARADRLPDPTVGVFTASEAFRSERVVGLSLSIPLGGTYRAQAALEAAQQAEVARAGVDRETREIEVEVATQVAEAASSLERWRLAEQATAAAGDAARLTQRAYTLGEADLQTLLLVRRQSLDTINAAASARADALRARYRLLIDAQMLWELGAD
jgi:cobalt-zinc-cadmium efflux system outer membrane protein